MAGTNVFRQTNATDFWGGLSACSYHRTYPLRSTNQAESVSPIIRYFEELKEREGSLIVPGTDGAAKLMFC